MSLDLSAGVHYHLITDSLNSLKSSQMTQLKSVYWKKNILCSNVIIILHSMFNGLNGLKVSTCLGGSLDLGKQTIFQINDNPVYLHLYLLHG